MENKNKDITESKVCPFCKGTGIAKCFDFSENTDLTDGKHDLNDLIEEKGTYTECPEGCKPMN